jgi:hypothetical protein
MRPVTVLIFIVHLHLRAILARKVNGRMMGKLLFSNVGRGHEGSTFPSERNVTLKFEL